MKFALTLCVSAMLLWGGLAHADAKTGKSTYAARGCIGCHGAGGVSTLAANPTLKGRSAEFIRQTLTEFRSGERKNPVMNAMAAQLKDEDIEHIADYIESLK